jgi:hypothetical protein
MLASADGLALSLVGAALLILGVIGSVPLALVHAGRTFFAIDAASFRGVGVAWLVSGGLTTFGVLALASGGADQHVVPFLPIALVGPFLMAAAARRTSGGLAAGRDGGSADVWSNRLAPLIWLAILAYFIVVVGPKT